MKQRTIIFILCIALIAFGGIGTFMGYRVYVMWQLEKEQVLAFTEFQRSLPKGMSLEQAFQALSDLDKAHGQFGEDSLTSGGAEVYEKVKAQLQSVVDQSFQEKVVELTSSDIDQVNDTETLNKMVADIAALTQVMREKRSLSSNQKAIDGYLAQLSERETACQQRVQAIEEAKRKATEEEARKKAEEEARQRAEEEARQRAEEEAARRAANRYDHRDFMIDFPDEWAGKWNVSSTHATDYGATYLVSVSGVTNNPSGGGADSIVLGCGGNDLSRPGTDFIGRTSDGRCDVYIRHEYGFPFLNQSTGMGAATLTIK